MTSTATSSPAVVAAGVSKMFYRGERHDSLRDLIPSAINRWRGRKSTTEPALHRDAFWAVQDVSFEVPFGRALGIIGPNGAGKSTMLKLLTGILRPTRGEIRMRGRVASLIEVSAGFHQDLTGRENVYLQGSILGMNRAAIDQRLDSIIDFSGIEPFIDTPVKRYSSGMNARLGFSIAVHLDPDVLVIDEVLSVGDVSFQEKCVARMRQFKRDGVGIIFVSHNMQAVGELCDEALVVKGTVRFHGPVGEAMSKYLALTSGKDGTAAAGDGVTSLGTRLTDTRGNEVEAVDPHTRLQLHADLQFDRALDDLSLTVVVRRTTDSQTVYEAYLPLEIDGSRSIAAGTTARLRVDHQIHLARGQYSYEVGVYDVREDRHRVWVGPAAGVRVDEHRTWGGIVDLDGVLHASSLHAAEPAVAVHGVAAHVG